jgi:transcriptional regulator with XRE-family HTH domain/uncharacterized protein YktA (UPF0223 family)
MNISERIKEIRKGLKLTQSDVAGKMELTPQNYNLLENGKTELTYSKIIKLAEIFGVSVVELLGEGASVVVVGGGEGAKEVDAMKARVQELQEKIVLLEKLNLKNEEENDNMRELLQEVLSYLEDEASGEPLFDSIDLRFTFCGVPVIGTEFRFGLDDNDSLPYSDTTLWGYMGMPPQPLEKNQKYVLFDVVDMRLFDSIFFLNPMVRYILDSNFIKNEGYLERYKAYKNVVKAEIDLLRIYKDEANKLYNPQNYDVESRQAQLVTAWETAKKIFQSKPKTNKNVK